MRTQKKYPLVISLIFMLVLAAPGCRKTLEQKPEAGILQSSSDISAAEASSGTCVEDQENVSTGDSILQPTILGYQLINQPYSLQNMRQAYINLYGHDNGISETNKYVRFKPSSPEQLSTLEDIDIDLYDYPLNYDVLRRLL